MLNWLPLSSLVQWEELGDTLASFLLTDSESWLTENDLMHAVGKGRELEWTELPLWGGGVLEGGAHRGLRGCGVDRQLKVQFQICLPAP